MSEKKYLNIEGLTNFLANLRNTFSDKSHTHTISNVTNLQSELDSLESSIASKSDSAHTHDDRYYTETEIDTKLSNKVSTSTTVNGKALSGNITLSASDVNADASGAASNSLTSAKSYTDEQIDSLISGDVTVAEAEHASTATTCTGNAATATKASQDDAGNVITETYETKVAASAKLTEAKTYADNVATTVKNDLLNGAGSAYDTLKELGDLIDTNVEAIDALETVAAGKADANHNHDDVYYTEDEIDEKVSTLDASIATKAPIKNGTYAVITAGDNTAYTATVPSITSLTAGVSFIMIPHVSSGTTTPTLDVNGLGAKNIKRRLSNMATSLQAGYSNSWLAVNKPFRVVYDGSSWVVEGHEKPNAADMYGLTATVTELNYSSGVTGSVQEQIDSKAANDIVVVSDTEPTSDTCLLWVQV